MDIHFNTPEELLGDESFLLWATNRNTAAPGQWEQWMQQNPAREGMVKEALALLQDITVNEAVPVAMIDAAEYRLLKNIETKKAAVVVSFFRKYGWVAAACIVFLVVSGTLWNTYFASSGIKTAYGEINEKTLPDGSQVTLNANSSILYNKRWKEGVDREVWIKGEAFFHVQKTVNHSKFVVHANGFDVVVTGTQFNIVNRDDKTNVMLTEGSVTILTKDGKTIHMKPGDFVQLDANQIEKKEVKKETVLAWKEHKLVFDNMQLGDVAKIIKEQYGATVTIADDSLAQKAISGILPNDNLDILIQALQATGDFIVTQSGKDILIANPK